MFFKELSQIFLEIAKEHGQFVALAVTMLFFAWFLIVWLIRIVIRQKHAEIERLVKERNKLQDMILKKRLSTKNSNVEK